MVQNAVAAPVLIQPKYGAHIVASTARRGAIERPVTGLYQPRQRNATIPWRAAKTVKVSIAAPILLETEDRPRIPAAARTCCSVKPSICRQQQPALRVLPVQGRAENGGGPPDRSHPRSP